MFHFFYSQWNGPFTDLTSLVLVLTASGDWKCIRAYKQVKISADFGWLTEWLKLVNDSWPTPVPRCYSGLKHHHESPHRLLPPTNQDGVENPRPVGRRLDVSVLVHSLDGRSHVERIHLMLGEETNVKGEQGRNVLLSVSVKRKKNQFEATEAAEATEVTACSSHNVNKNIKWKETHCLRLFLGRLDTFFHTELHWTRITEFSPWQKKKNHIWPFVCTLLLFWLPAKTFPLQHKNECPLREQKGCF